MRAQVCVRGGLAVALTTGFLAFAGCGERSEGTDGVEVTRGALVTTSFTVTIKTPKTVPLTNVALGAEGSLTTGSDLVVRAPAGTGQAVITNMGTATLTPGPRNTMDELWSTAPVSLSSGVKILGKVHAQSVTLAGGATISGGIDRTTPLTPASTTTWTVEFKGTAATVDVGSGKSTAAPGRYAKLRAAGGAELTLKSGTYYVDTLQLEAQSKLVLDQGTGPVILYVSTTALWIPTVRTVQGTPADVLLVYLGTSDVAVSSPFTGAVVAPRAKLTVASVAGGHTGAFFAKNLVIGASMTLTFKPPHSILTAASPGRRACQDGIVPRLDLTGRAREVQYQQDVLRYCLAPALGPCETLVRARLNVDYYAAAASFLREGISPAQYIAFLRDRRRKMNKLEGSETTACPVANDDPDGDFVPTSADACPATPELMPTKADGCTDTTPLPVAPLFEDVKKNLRDLGFTTDPRCVTAPSPIVPAPLGAWRFPSDPAVGKAVWVSRDPDVSGCPLFYELQVDLTDGAGTRSLIIPAASDTTLSWITKPAAAVQLNIKTSDGGVKGSWANYGVYTERYRARAINGGGRRSEWSQWFTPGKEDCVAGSPCRD